MLNQQKKLIIVYPLLLFFFLYFISILLKLDFLGNIFSPIVAFLASLLIFVSIRKIKNSKIYSILLFICCFIWVTADFFWFIADDIILTNPFIMSILNTLYVLPNILFAVLLTYYIYQNYEHWNIYQLIIDIFTFCAIGMVLLWSFFFSKTNFNFDFALILFYIFIDFYVLVELFIIYFSKNFKINPSWHLIFFGILIYASCDYYYTYLSFLDAYEANTFLDIVYMMSNVLFSLGILYEASNPTLQKNTEEYNELSENLRKPKKSYFFINIVFILLYWYGFLNLNTLTILIFICVIYWVLTVSVRANMLDKLLLKSEKEMNEQLEQLIVDRTKELNLANQHLEEISYKDILTGLYNRRYLIRYLEELISSNNVEHFALLYIDANRFKPINDSYGHETGDKVLTTLGKRFLECSYPQFTPFRIGGDEFAVIIEDFSDTSELSYIADKLFEKLQLPISVPPYSFSLTASVGIALYPADASDMDLLMRYADIAMFEVKSSNYKSNYLFFDKILIEKNNKKHEIELLLQNVDYDKDFMLYYQPQYNTDDQSLIGMEALIRWIHPQKGFISPSKFIPIAEETGMIIHIGAWVVEKAFTQIKEWNQNYSLNLKMSINISPIQIKNVGFVDWLWAKMQSHQIKPEWIDLEITESVAMISNSTIEKIFDLLNNIGISISIDDFGTGYSSLSYIQKYNIDRLKIAKELIDNIAVDANSLLIVQAIIMMAKGMNLKIISEGVEDINQLKILNSIGCNEIQGYIFGKPVSSNEFEEMHLKNKFLDL